MKRINAYRAITGAAGAGLIMISLPAAAQQTDARLDRIERQLGALQRAVFPGGDERFFEPEITPQRTTTPTLNSPGVSTSALTDVLARLDAIEAQLARLTAATEVNDNALAGIEARITALESRPVSAAPANTGDTLPPSTQQPTGVIPVPGASPASSPASSSAPGPQPVQPSPERVAAVEAIVKPQTGDAGEDEYTYGFRLWDAGFYPEAQQQLALFLDRHPDHRLNSRGRNLLGRAFLDAGDPRAAATHFFDNYQSDAQGDRAGDSLLYLAQSMIELSDTNRACIALAEFGDTYPALAIGRLQTQYDTLRGRVTCG